MADPCSRCGGTGKIYVDDLHERECLCAHVRALKAHLGPAVVKATSIEASPLFIPGANPGDPDQDRTADNLFLKGHLKNLMSHVKYALVWKGRMFPFKLVTDQEILVVWLGKESYGSRSKNLRDDLETFNSLNDFIGPDRKLVIIQLWGVYYKNVAMPGALKEALMIRRMSGEATWILEDTHAPFGPGHFAYSDEAADIIAENYDVMELSGPYKPEDNAESSVPAAIEDVGLSEPPQDIPRYTKSRFEPNPSRGGIENDPALSSGFKRNNGGRKPRGGGGPI